MVENCILFAIAIIDLYIESEEHTLSRSVFINFINFRELDWYWMCHYKMHSCIMALVYLLCLSSCIVSIWSVKVSNFIIYDGKISPFSPYRSTSVSSHDDCVCLCMMSDYCTSVEIHGAQCSLYDKLLLVPEFEDKENNSIFKRGM